MYPLDFLSLQLDEALSRPLSTHGLPLSLYLSLSLSNFRESRGDRESLHGIPRYESGHRYGPRWIAPGTWEARSAGEMETNQLHKIELWIYFTLFSIVREFQAKFAAVERGLSLESSDLTVDQLFQLSLNFYDFYIN